MTELTFRNVSTTLPRLLTESTYFQTQSRSCVSSKMQSKLSLPLHRDKIDPDSEEPQTANRQNRYPQERGKKKCSAYLLNALRNYKDTRITIHLQLNSELNSPCSLQTPSDWSPHTKTHSIASTNLTPISTVTRLLNQIKQAVAKWKSFEGQNSNSNSQAATPSTILTSFFPPFYSTLTLCHQNLHPLPNWLRREVIASFLTWTSQHNEWRLGKRSYVKLSHGRVTKNDDSSKSVQVWLMLASDRKVKGRKRNGEY